MPNEANLLQPRSLHSRCTIPVSFVNRSERHVDVYWIDFKGQLVRYINKFAPGQRKGLHTFATHPWVAADNVTGQRLYLTGQPVYVTPTPPPDEDGEEAVEGRPIEITIHIPVYRLQDLCIGFFRTHLTTEEMSRLDVSEELLAKLHRQKPETKVYQPQRE